MSYRSLEIEARYARPPGEPSPAVHDLVRRRRPPLMRVVAVGDGWVDCRWHDESTGEDCEARFSPADLEVEARPRLAASPRADADPAG